MIVRWHKVTKNDTNSQWSLFFTDLDALLSDYDQHRSMNDIAITENLTIHLENAVCALQNVSLFLSQTDREAVLKMTRNFQLMFWDCHPRCEYWSQTRYSQVAILLLGSPNRPGSRCFSEWTWLFSRTSWFWAIWDPRGYIYRESAFVNAYRPS